uniref:Uncharacterized protein n=1 Tax=Amazona collaria TaxID=241587 RepID=A0A8B9GDQ4_9PSIT
WACYTGRSESAFIMQKLMDRPCPEQLCDQYKPEWPKMKELLAKAAEPKSCLQRFSECMRAAISFRSFYGPEADGVLDHMVKVTTSLRSPFIALSCRTVCPGSPPSVGKRRLAVQEILRQQRAEEIRSQDKDHISSYEKLFQNSKVTLIPKKKDREFFVIVFNCETKGDGETQVGIFRLIFKFVLKKTSQVYFEPFLIIARTGKLCSF